MLIQVINHYPIHTLYLINLILNYNVYHIIFLIYYLLLLLVSLYMFKMNNLPFINLIHHFYHNPMNILNHFHLIIMNVFMNNIFI